MTNDEYQRTAKALARETRMSDASASRIEQKLVSALSEREVAVSRSPMWLPPLGGRKLMWLPLKHSMWLTVAAALVVLVGTFSLWNVSRVPVDTTTSQRTASEKPSTLADVVLPPSPKPVIATNANPAPVNRSARKAATARVVRPDGFIELPWTAGLPAFESGEIVRVEVPVASLPAYGFDISRGTSRNIEADVLVGQDGLARAMRLVSNSARSTQ